MTLFAILFMSVSMISVICLTGYCMYRILGGGNPGPADGDGENEPPGG